MKTVYVFPALLLFTGAAIAQAHNNHQNYPQPEYANEIYFFDKTGSSLVRLEKNSATMQSKARMGSAETSYTIDDVRSRVRLQGDKNLHFIFYLGDDGGAASAEDDSAAKASGIDFSMMESLDKYTNPVYNTTLFTMSEDKGNRKTVIQSTQGMRLLGKASKENTKYTFSIKKVKPGYYEMLVDKILPKGEYTFIIRDMMATDNSSLLFAFGID